MTTRTYSRSDLIDLSTTLAPVIDLAPDFDGSDPWGSVMGLWFDAAEILHSRDVEIPAEWEYRHGLGLDELNPLLVDHETDYLRLLGTQCSRAAETLRELGLDY